MEPTGNEEDREAQMGDMLLYISSYCKSECNSQDNSIEGLDNELDYLLSNLFLAGLSTFLVIEEQGLGPRINIYLTNI